MSRLKPPPWTPNCVSSRAARDHRAYIEPLPVPPGGLDQAVALATAMEGASLRERDGNWAHLVYVTRIMRYRDDLELELDGDVLHVRSASRLGYGDGGLNRKRVEALRALLLEAE